MGYRENLNECIDPVAGDWMEITNTGNATDKEQKVDAGRFAILANLQTFTATQTFAPSGTGANATVITMPTSTSALAMLCKYGAVDRFYLTISAAATQLSLASADMGNNITGPAVVLGRNTNATNSSAGSFGGVRKGGGAVDYLWNDNTGVWRTNTSAPTGTTDTSGSVVGAQTSWHEFKEDIVAWADPQQALDAVLACRLFQYHLKGDATKRQYAGLVITGDDRGAWFSENDGEHQIPSLNERNLFGYLIGAVQTLSAQVEALKAEVETLKNAN